MLDGVIGSPSIEAPIASIRLFSFWPARWEPATSSDTSSVRTARRRDNRTGASAVLALRNRRRDRTSGPIRAKLAAYRRPLAARHRGNSSSWSRARSGLTGWSGRPLRSTSALNMGSSPAPISLATRSTPCSDHSTQPSRPSRSGRCSSHRGGCRQCRSDHVPGLSS